jgi:hypothetical protein
MEGLEALLSFEARKSICWDISRSTPRKLCYLVVLLYTLFREQLQDSEPLNRVS